MSAIHRLRSPSITPSIRVPSPLASPLRSAFYRFRSPLLLSPLIPLERSNLAPGLERPAQFGSLEERKARGRNSPDCQHAHVDIQARADRRHARPQPGASARVRDSFAAIARHSTAANAWTHQRVPQRVCPFFDPPCFPASHRRTARRANSVRHQRLLPARSAQTLCWGHIGRGFRARTAATPFTLGDTARPAANWLTTARDGGCSSLRNPKSRGGGGKKARSSVFELPHHFRGRLSRIWAAPLSEISVQHRGALLTR